MAVWHKLTARPGIEIRSCIPRPRAVFVRAAEPMHGTSSVGSASVSGAHWAQEPQPVFEAVFFHNAHDRQPLSTTEVSFLYLTDGAGSGIIGYTTIFIRDGKA